MRSLTTLQAREIKRDCRHLTRRVWIALVVMIALTISFGWVTRAIHVQGKEARNAADSR